MLAIPHNQQFFPEDNNGRGPTQDGFGIALASGGPATGYGAYTEITYTCIEPSYGMSVMITGVALSTGIRRAIVNIAYGASGAEAVVVKDLLCSFRSGGIIGNASIYLPIYTPPFTRVSMNIAWDGTGTTISAFADISLLAGSSTPDPIYRTFQGCDTYGITSVLGALGTDVSSDLVAGTYGPVVKFGPTTREYKAVLLVPGGENTATFSGGSFYAKLQTGTSEESTLLSIACEQISDERIVGPIPGFPVVVNIPSGTDLNVSLVRANGGLRKIDWAVYCFY